tara:strand:+ start:6955 stop:7410 length:456 start_codon:yes stop_codon:yes gene_type:complete
MYKKKPISQKKAFAFIKEHHRHFKSIQGDVFRIGLLKDGRLIGVISVGRPVSRYLDDGYTCEVRRLCINGQHKNACSILYSSAARAAKALGYEKIITYILENESGVSVRAAGWEISHKSRGQNWSRTSRPRDQKSLFQTLNKVCYHKILKG